MGLGLFCAKEKLKINNSFRKIRFFISVMYTITPDESPVAGKEFQCPLGPRLFFPVRINQNKRSDSLRVSHRDEREPDMEKFDGHKHVDIVFERPKLHIEVDAIQHNQSPKQALSDLKRTFYSIQEGFITLRIPNVLVRNELNKTVDYLVELILERYYKNIK